jgi:hypothetical protein
VCIAHSNLLSLEKAMKTPNFEDSRRAIVEHDFFQGLNVQKWLRDLQHLHTLLNDLINKNYKSLRSLQTPVRYGGENNSSAHARRRTRNRLNDENDEDDDGFSFLFG